MRRSGKTTRTIDQAIQTLFIEGAVIIPLIKDIGLDGINRKEIVMDPDMPNKDMQQDIIRRIQGRLIREHSHVKFQTKGNRIALVSE